MTSNDTMLGASLPENAIDELTDLTRASSSLSPSPTINFFSSALGLGPPATRLQTLKMLTKMKMRRSTTPMAIAADTDGCILLTQRLALRENKKNA